MILAEIWSFIFSFLSYAYNYLPKQKFVILADNTQKGLEFLFRLYDMSNIGNLEQSQDLPRPFELASL